MAVRGGPHEPVPLSDLPPELAASARALWLSAHARPCAGDVEPGAGTLALVAGEQVAAVGALREWGRTAHVHGLVVAESFRRRGLGAALLDALVAEAQRRDASVIGLEVDGAGAAALTVLARAGLKPMQLSFLLEGASIAAAGAESPPVRVLAGEDAEAACASVRELAASVDAEMDPTDWLLRTVRAGQVEIAVLDGDGAPALAVLPRPGEGADALVVTMLLADEGPPYARLGTLVTGLALHAHARGLASIQVAAPSRYWEPVRALLDLGLRPSASFLRLTRHGYPERADVRRVNLASWR